MSKWLDITALTLYCGLIYWLSSQKFLPAQSLFSVQDKVEHAGAYFIMSLLAWRCFRHGITQAIFVFWWAVGFCSFYGATDEWHQSFVVGRNASSLDWLADSLGASLAMIILYLFKRKVLKKSLFSISS